MKEILIVYMSKTGNTEKVAKSIQRGLEEKGGKVDFKFAGEGNVNFFNYDLIMIGTPVYHWLPPKNLLNYLRSKYQEYKEQGYVKLGAPKLPGRKVIIFCTYSGPHTGKNEAIPAVKYIGQFFEHLGFTILDEWYILSEFNGSIKASTEGRMGDIRGLPSQKDLKDIKEKAKKLI